MTKMRFCFVIPLVTVLLFAAGCAEKPVHCEGNSNAAYDPRTKDAKELSGPNFAIRVKGVRHHQAFFVT